MPGLSGAVASRARRALAARWLFLLEAAMRVVVKVEIFLRLRRQEPAAQHECR